MDESPVSPDSDASDSSTKTINLPETLVNIAATGDVILDVVFENSKATLRAAGKAAAATVPRPRPGQALAHPAVLKTKLRVGYRVQLDVVKKNSKYFNNLLGDTRFQEAKTVATAIKRLSRLDIKPAEAELRDLPLVRIVEDDEATKSVGREVVFGDLLRILHGQSVITKPVTMSYVATLAVMADRFDCTSPVSRSLSSVLKFKWPVTQPPVVRDDTRLPKLSRAAEETLRQKILVSWLLDQPMKMHQATRELIMYGSGRWSAFSDEDDKEPGTEATWWDLQDGLESELQYRRERVLNTIASVQQHFLRLYTSRVRQCQLGYDSSSSCDSYQLGEVIKFLCNRNLLVLVDYSPNSLAMLSDLAAIDINRLLATLRQCPSYQIDKNHTNCGLRTRILPILDYIQSMLSSNVLSISRNAWKSGRDAASWILSQEEQERDDSRDECFRFTRLVSGDARLRYEGAMATDRMAKALFTATYWDWTPEV